VIASPIVGVNGPSIALYFSGRHHAGENVADLLAARSGQLRPPIRVSDAGSSNLVGKLEVIDAGCWAHARRKFTDIEKEFPEQVARVLDAVGKMYQVDKEAKGRSPDERLLMHQERSQPVVEELRRWMQAQLDERIEEPNSSLGAAYKYVLGNVVLLTTLLRTAGVPLDNNPAERAAKRPVRHRRNSLFFRNEIGAVVGDVILSAIESCAVNRVDPIEYLTRVVVHRDEVRRDPAAWLPWTYPGSRAREGPPPQVEADATPRGSGLRRGGR
jgi:transposase